MSELDRRAFIKSGLGVAAGLGLAPALARPSQAQTTPSAQRLPAGPGLAKNDKVLEAATVRRLDELQKDMLAELAHDDEANSLRTELIHLSMKEPWVNLSDWYLNALAEERWAQILFTPLIPFTEWMCEPFLLLTSIDGGAGQNNDPSKVYKFVKQMKAMGFGVSMDNVGDAAISDQGARQYYDFYRELILRSGSVPDLDQIWMSIKLSAMVYDLRAALGSGPAVENKCNEIVERLGGLMKAASEPPAKHIHVRIDMEEYIYKDLTIAMFKRAVEKNLAHFRNSDGSYRMGLVIQAYLRDSAKDLKGLGSWAQGLGVHAPIRLVKGAYEQYEKDVAQEQGRKSPVWNYKPSTDANFEALSEYLLLENDAFAPAIATHNMRSMSHAMAAAKLLGRGKPEIQMLYGMGDPIKKAVIDDGFPMRVYVPTGSLYRGVQYAGRRFRELANGDNALAKTMRGNFTCLDGGPPAFLGAQDMADGRVTMDLLAKAKA